MATHRDNPADHKSHIRALETEAEWLRGQLQRTDTSSGERRLRTRRLHALEWAIPWLWMIYELEAATTKRRLWTLAETTGSNAEGITRGAP